MLFWGSPLEGIGTHSFKPVCLSESKLSISNLSPLFIFGGHYKQLPQTCWPEKKKKAKIYSLTVLELKIRLGENVKMNSSIPCLWLYFYWNVYKHLRNKVFISIRNQTQRHVFWKTTIFIADESQNLDGNWNLVHRQNRLVDMGGEGKRWDELGDWDWHIYTTMCKTDS